MSVYVTLDAEVHERMFRSGRQCNARLPEFSPQASLVNIYRPTEGIFGRKGRGEALTGEKKKKEMKSYRLRVVALPIGVSIC
ncbi:hypothetical protein TNCV_4621441 [Trichonephila clavipes]|nr:hypothetical protein TNCV_4621441 [Trichonephila clavipes]